MPGRPSRQLPPVNIAPRQPQQPPEEADLPPTAAATLHIALVVPTLAAYNTIKDRVRLVRPPYWKGTVHVHVLIDNPKHPLDTGDLMVAQAAYELGWGTLDNLVVEAPETVSLGFEK